MSRRRRYWRLRWLWNTDEPIPGPAPARRLAQREYELKWRATYPPDRARTGRTARVEGERAPTPAEAARMVRRQHREVIGGAMRVSGMTVSTVGRQQVRSHRR